MITLSASPVLAPTGIDTASRGAHRHHLPAAAGFDAPLPRGLRKEAEDMSWDTFLAEYAPASGPLRLGHWACADAERPAGRLGPQARNFVATLAVGDRIGTSRAAATGPVAALTEMLHELGIAVEMTAFHQIPAGGDIATVIHGSDGTHTEWAVGLSDDATLSALRAVIACANRLLAAA
jgi:hypothetical protein